MNDSREAGYLAGFFDGEGYLSGRLNKFHHRVPARTTAVVNDYVQDLLIKKGSLSPTTPRREARQGPLNGGMGEDAVPGADSARAAAAQFHDASMAAAIYGSANPAVDIVQSVSTRTTARSSLGTSTNTLVADGLLSHNTKTGKFYELYPAWPGADEPLPGREAQR